MPTAFYCYVSEFTPNFVTTYEADVNTINVSVFRLQKHVISDMIIRTRVNLPYGFWTTQFLACMFRVKKGFRYLQGQERFA